MRSPAVHVVAGVVRDAQARILLAQRPAGRHLAGLWEFPGGKCESGEAPRAALRRELHEELGIDAGALERVIRVPWQYPEKSILLDVYEVMDYRGVPRGRESQALSWVHLHDLDPSLMPAADRPVIAALRLVPLYAITPEPTADIGGFLAQLDGLLASGIRLLQLRAKHCERDALRELARAARTRVHANAAQLLINSDFELARELDLDGVHLTAAQLWSLDLRPLGRHQWVAASCHDATELDRAVQLGVDFAVLGPVARSTSHADGATLGWARFAQLCAGSSLPIYALGGLRRADLDAARAFGAHGIAGISAFWPAS